jgi:hypothetical protein
MRLSDSDYLETTGYVAWADALGDLPAVAARADIARA